MSCSSTHDIEDYALKPDTNIGDLFGDIYKEVIADNPYYQQDEKILKKMNAVHKPGEIAHPIYTNSEKIDMKLLRAYTEDILKEKTLLTNYEVANRNVAKKYHKMCKKVDVYYMYCLMCKESNIVPSDEIRGALQIHSYRSQSGVIVYAVFTHPFFRYTAGGKLHNFSCKYDCDMFPNMPGFPRSYVPGEPGNDRDATSCIYLYISLYFLIFLYSFHLFGLFF
jgi:hypothetical protein